MTHTHRTRLLSMLGLAALVASVFPSPSLGQGGFNAALNGAWRLQGSVPQAEQTVQQAVEPAVAPLAPDVQRLARSRIAETTWVPQTITVSASPARINIVYQGSESRTFDTAPGQPENVYSRSGVRAQMIQSFRPDGGIEQSFRAMDGTQANILSVHGNEMHLDVLMQSRRLQGEVRFRLVYAR